jgi:hypothetical protein
VIRIPLFGEETLVQDEKGVEIGDVGGSEMHAGSVVRNRSE